MFNLKSNHRRSFWDVVLPFHFPEEGIADNTEVEDNEEEENEEEVVEDNEEKEEKEEKEEEPVLTRVEFKDITGKYPNFFKDYPQLKEAFFREQKFTEVFPTIEEAEAALEIQEAYEEISAAVVSGDAKKFLTDLKEENSDGLKKFTNNFLPALHELDNELYRDMVTPVLQHYVKQVYLFGVKEKDENAQNAAKVVHKLLFGGDSSDIEKDSPLVNKGKSERELKDEEELKGREQAKYLTLYKDVTNVCYTKLDEEIAKGLEDLKTTPGLKKMVIKGIKEQVLEQMEKDPNYMKRLNALWRREHRSGFNGSLKNSLVTTFLGKAKVVIPAIRTTVRKEVLGKEDKTGKNESIRLSGGRESKGTGKVMTPARAKAEGLTTKGIFDA